MGTRLSPLFLSFCEGFLAESRLPAERQYSCYIETFSSKNV